MGWCRVIAQVPCLAHGVVRVVLEARLAEDGALVRVRVRVRVRARARARVGVRVWGWGWGFRQGWAGLRSGLRSG